MNPGVALQTKFTPFTPNQKHAVRTAVRIVACGAAIDLPGRMFENKRPVFFDMTLRTRFRCRLDQIRCVWGAVWIVAIRALHQSFRNSMMYRQRELSLDHSVARVAKLRL
jgi:hypothetical protein